MGDRLNLWWDRWVSRKTWNGEPKKMESNLPKAKLILPEELNKSWIAS